MKKPIAWACWLDDADPNKDVPQLSTQEPRAYPQRVPLVPMCSDDEMARDAARYRWLKDNGYVNGKTLSRAVIGDDRRVKAAFRYWCLPDDLDDLIDEKMT